MTRTLTSNAAVIAHLEQGLLDLEKRLAADCLCYVGPIAFGVDGAIRDAVEDIAQRRDKTERRDKLVFVLETNGGLRRRRCGFRTP